MIQILPRRSVAFVIWEVEAATRPSADIHCLSGAEMLLVARDEEIFQRICLQ
jgi:hypothetical protein